MLKLKLHRLPHGADLPLPQYQSAGAAAMDLNAAIAEPITIEPGRYVCIPTGFAFELPPGTEGQIRPRSGLAAKFGISIVNTPGTIDEDYRGEVMVLLINLGQEPYTVQPKDRIAQMVIAPVTKVLPVEVEQLTESVRGTGAFGSTGVRHDATASLETVKQS